MTSSAPRGIEDWTSPFILDEARTMARRGVRTSIVCPRMEKGPSTRDQLAGIPVCRVSYLPPGLQRRLVGDAGGMPAAVQSLRGRVEAIPLLGSLAFAAEREVRRMNADLVVAHWVETGIAGLWAARRSGIPCVVRVHRWNPRGVAEDLVGRWVTRGVAAVLANSAYVRDRILMQGCDAPIFVVPPGLDARFNEPARRGHGLDIPSGRPVVLAVGRLVPKKGHGILLDAMQEVLARGRVQPLVVVAGDGPEAGVIRRHAVMRNGDGIAPGAVGRSVVHGLMEAADLFVQPSRVDDTGESETYGVAVVEAQLAGLPVIVSASGALPSRVMNGRGGRVVGPDSSGELANAIESMLLDPIGSKQLAEAGQSLARQEVDRSADLLMDAIRRSMDRGSRIR